MRITKKSQNAMRKFIKTITTAKRGQIQYFSFIGTAGDLEALTVEMEIVQSLLPFKAVRLNIDFDDESAGRINAVIFSDVKLDITTSRRILRQCMQDIKNNR